MFENTYQNKYFSKKRVINASGALAHPMKILYICVIGTDACMCMCHM